MILTHQIGVILSRIRLHPNKGVNDISRNPVISVLPTGDDLDPYEIETDADIMLDYGLIKVIINKIGDLNQFEFALAKDLVKPGFTYDFESFKVAKFSSDLLINLDLTLTRYGLFGNGKNVIVDDSITYNADEAQRFRKMILHQGYYFSDTSNIEAIPANILSEHTKAVSLRNARVTLSWYNIDLLLVDQKKLMTYGIALLIGSITQAEFLMKVKETVPYYQYKLRVKTHLNKFVHIHIEEELFSF